MDVASYFVSCESKRGKIISECDLGFFPTLVRKVETAQMMIGVRAHKRFVTCLKCELNKYCRKLTFASGESSAVTPTACKSPPSACWIPCGLLQHCWESPSITLLRTWVQTIQTPFV